VVKREAAFAAKMKWSQPFAITGVARKTASGGLDFH